MAFRIPNGYEHFYDEAVQRFKLLLQRQIITGIDSLRLQGWLANFRSEEDRYLAARILDGLIYRSDRMVCSSLEHLVHCELQSYLKIAGLLRATCLLTFQKSLSCDDSDLPFRFVALDGQFEATPGKSGAVLIRRLRQQLEVHKVLTCRPERLYQLPDSVKSIIFLDDFLGTGTQFDKFAKHYKLNEQQSKFKMLYCPLIAHEKGIQALVKKYPWITVRPIEQLDSTHAFFRPSTNDGAVWGVDEFNALADVKKHCEDLAARGEIPPRTQYSLELLLGFEFSAPNNTLPLLWAKSARWSPLLQR